MCTSKWPTFANFDPHMWGSRFFFNTAPKAKCQTSWGDTSRGESQLQEGCDFTGTSFTCRSSKAEPAKIPSFNFIPDNQLNSSFLLRVKFPFSVFLNHSQNLTSSLTKVENFKLFVKSYMENPILNKINKNGCCKGRRWAKISFMEKQKTGNGLCVASVGSRESKADIFIFVKKSVVLTLTQESCVHFLPAVGSCCRPVCPAPPHTDSVQRLHRALGTLCSRALYQEVQPCSPSPPRLTFPRILEQQVPMSNL